MSAPSPNGASGGLVLIGATMELGGTQGPATVVTDVILTMSQTALVVAPPPPSPPVSITWPSVADARCGEPGLLLDGSPAVAVSAIVEGRFVRWLVPAGQLPPERVRAIDELLTTWTGRVPGAPSPLAPGPERSVKKAEPAPRTAETPPVARDTRENGRVPPGAAATRRRSPRATTVAPTAPATHRRRRSGLLGSGVTGVIWMAVALLVVIGAAVLGTGLVTVSSTPGTAHHPSPADQGVLQAVRVRTVDLPTGWTATRTPKGPLSGFVGGAGVTAVGVGAYTAEHKAIASQYDQCMGVAPPRSFLFGAGSRPVAHGASPAFTGPSTGPPIEVASRTAVYSSATTVRRAAVQFASPRFADCFGTAVGRELRLSATASGSGTALVPGAAKVEELPLPRWAGVRATGVDLALPLQFHGSETTVQLGFVFVTGGRVESTLLTFSTTQFPTGLTQALAATVEEEIAANAPR